MNTRKPHNAPAQPATTWSDGLVPPSIPPTPADLTSREGGISIPRAEIAIRFSRSGGPGGQNVNKVATKVTISFNYATSRALSSEEKARLEHHPRIVNRLDSDGNIVVSHQAHRTQALNRRAAIEKLRLLIEGALHQDLPRESTKRPAIYEQQRVENKRVQGRKKDVRRAVRLDDE